MFRSGELQKLTDADVTKLDDLGIKTVVSYLTPVEIKSRGEEDRLPIETDDGLAAAIEQARSSA